MVRGKIKLYIYIIHIDISQRFTTVFVPLNRLQIRACYRCYRKSPSNLHSSQLVTTIGFFFHQISKINNVDGFCPTFSTTLLHPSLSPLRVYIYTYNLFIYIYIYIIYIKRERERERDKCLTSFCLS